MGEDELKLVLRVWDLLDLCGMREIDESQMRSPRSTGSSLSGIESPAVHSVVP
jgi:hypothetical protein